MALFNHQNNAGTNLTSNTTAGATTSPVNSVPSMSAPFYAVFDATNINNKYEVVLITSKTATNINHAATAYDHTTAEEVRFAMTAAEADAIWDGLGTGWNAFPAGVTLAYSSADDPTYVVTTSSDCRTYIGVGDRVKFTNNSTTFYGIVTAIAAGTITLYGGTDYDVANSAITSPYFSHVKSPVGFPVDPTKWTVSVTDATSRSQASPVSGTWYNLGSVSITIPIGAWDTSYRVTAGIAENGTAADFKVSSTLSTANNSESDSELTTSSICVIWTGSHSAAGSLFARKHLVLATKTPYYLNSKVVDAGIDSLINYNDSSKAVLRAVCAYL